jgi:hypothetical protein
MESPKPGGATSIGAWSAFAGATRSRVVDLIITNLFNVCVIVAAVIMFAAVGSPIIWLGAVLAIASLIVLGWLMRRDISRGRALLAIYQAPRIVVLIAVAAAYLARRPDETAWIWAATGLAIFAIMFEPTVRLLMSKATPVAVQLPGFPSVPRSPFNPSFVALAPLATAAAGGLLALIGAPGWCYLLIVVVGITPALIMIGYTIRAVQISRRSSVEVRKALQQYPTRVLRLLRRAQRCPLPVGHVAAPSRAAQPAVHRDHAASAYGVPDHRSDVSASTGSQLKSSNGRLWHLVVDSLKAAFYVQNHTANVDMLRFPQLTHIWLNHGDSDKAANYSARHAAFDKIFVSGQQGVDRYAAHGVRIRPEQFAIVGRPQIERIETRDELLPADAPRTVLYAPTWHGGKPNTNYSSLFLGSKIIDALLKRGATVIFRPHPQTYNDPDQTGVAQEIQRKLSADRKAAGRQHVFGRAAETGWDIPDCFNHCDALITDVSSVASDFLATGKPLAMVAIQQKGDAFRQTIPSARVAYVIESDLSTLPEALDELLGRDSLADARRAYRSYCLGDALGAAAPLPFLREVERILDGGPPERRMGVSAERADSAARPARRRGTRTPAAADQSR